MPATNFDEQWQAFEQEAGPLLADEVSNQAPVETGWLANNQDWRDQEGVLQVYETDNRGPIPAYVIRGTMPHPIDPVRAQMLHWVDRETGEDVFARHVDHPGTAPNPYNLRAWQAQRETLVRRFAQMCGRDMALAFLNPWRKL